MIGKPAVADAQNARDTRQFSCGIERPGPPDLPGQKRDGFGAAVHSAVVSSDAHFLEQFLTRQGKKGLHARVLQRCETEPARFEGAAEAAGERSADGTVSVKEKPAAEGVPSFRISHF